MSIPNKYNNVITSLLEAITYLVWDATIVCFLDAKRLMVQESRVKIYDRVLMVARAYIKKKKGGKNNSKCPYCKDIGHINILVKKQRRI